jgi:large subunit ribosomal protein L24e
VIKAKKNQKPEFRATQRQKALADVKEKKKAEQEKKKAEQAKVSRTTAQKPKVSKQQAKGSAPKVQAKSR